MSRKSRTASYLALGRIWHDNAINASKQHQRNRRRCCRRLLIQSLQEGGMG